MEADILRIPVLKRGGEKVFKERTKKYSKYSKNGGGIIPKLGAGEKFFNSHRPQSPGIAAKWGQQKKTRRCLID